MLLNKVRMSSNHTFRHLRLFRLVHLMRRADTRGPCVYRLRSNPRAQRLVGVATFASAIIFFGRGAEAQLAGGGTTDPIIPFNDTSVRGSVSSFIDGPSATTVRPWTFSGDVDVEAGLTDSPGGIRSSGVQPVILIAPDFSLNGTTSRLNVALTYSPRLAIYPSTSSQTIVSQSFNGSADAVIVPNLLFLSVRGISDVGSRFGDTSLQSNSFVSRSEAVQTTSFSISPYLQRDNRRIWNRHCGLCVCPDVSGFGQSIQLSIPCAWRCQYSGFRDDRQFADKH